MRPSCVPAYLNNLQFLMQSGARSRIWTNRMLSLPQRVEQNYLGNLPLCVNIRKSRSVDSGRESRMLNLLALCRARRYKLLIQPTLNIRNRPRCAACTCDRRMMLQRLQAKTVLLEPSNRCICSTCRIKLYSWQRTRYRYQLFAVPKRNRKYACVPTFVICICIRKMFQIVIS